ncbi:MAG: hypothetical protein KIT20_05210 [Alphaproteobacteria bacterium]|nr:hypothetical protein [Alphaproteobacteria bacterium]
MTWPRPVRWVALGLGAFALLQFASRGYYWFWPDNPDALWNEALLLLFALLAGALALPWSAARAGGPAGLALLAAPLYLVASGLWLAIWPWQEAGLESHRHYIFSASFCEFTARFPRPPQAGRLPAAGAGEPDGRVALLSDLERLIAFRADCIAAPAAERETLRGFARAGLARWAQAASMRESVESGEDDVLMIRGEIRGSLVRGADQGGKTLGEARAYLGRHSVMTLSVLQSEAEVLTGPARDFLASGTWKGGVDLGDRSGVK